MRPVLWGAAFLFLCLPMAWARGQRAEAPRGAAPQARFSGPRARMAERRAERQQFRAQQQQRRYQQGPAARPGPGYRPAGPAASYPNANVRAVRPQANPGGAYARPPYAGPGVGPGVGPGMGSGVGAARPLRNYPGYAPPGHLQSWLNQHRGLPLQDQERLLRTDPTFARQAPREQQREMQQLHAVDQMPEQQRERRLARNEMLERLNPQQRMNLNQASRSYATLPPERREMVKRAFQDLRSVPLNERQTVLNSARYQGQFSPGERSILSNFLDVEPYQPPR